MKKAVATGEAEDVSEWSGSLNNIEFELYNVAKGTDISDFTLQNGNVIIKTGAEIGDEIRLTAKSKQNIFADASTTFSIAEGANSFSLALTELGGIDATYTSSSNSSTIGYLYDANSKLIAKGSYIGEKLSLRHLQSGTYTLITMGSSTLLGNMPSLASLDDVGLHEGSDYVATNVVVTDGLLTGTTINEVPRMDDTRFYYTSGDTYFYANKESLTAGNYLTLNAHLDFKPEYSDKTDVVRLSIDIPDGCQVVENSVIANRQAVVHTIDGNRLMMTLNKERWQGQIRFCVIPVLNQTYTLTAMASFDIDGNISQPIGTAQFEAKGLSLSTPKLTANTNTSVYRLRYYTDFSTVSSYANHTSDPNDAFTDIDFFTKPIRVCVKDTTESYSLYDRAYAATRTEATSAADLLTAVKNAALVDRITTVEYEYGLYKNGTTYGIMNKLDAEGIPTVIDKSHPHVAGINSNTIMLAIDYSNHIKDYRNSQDTTLMDLLPNGTIPYTNGPAPELSRAKGKNGAFIINSASYADFISNVFVSKPTNNMENNLTGTDPIPAMLSEEQLKYVNGVGIREEYYKNKTIFEFLNNLTMYDVTKPSETQKQDVVRVSRNPVYSKGVFDTITGTGQYTDFKEDFIYNNVKAVTNGAQFKIPSGINIKAYATRTTSTVSETLTNCSCSVVNCSYNDRIQVTVHRSGTSPTYWVNFSDIAERYTGFKDSNGDQVTMYAPITIVSKINFRNNKYGFNEAYIYSGTTSDTQDLTSYYISVDKIFASTEKAGEKQVTNVSLCDENGVPLNLNGILGDVEVDDLNWDTLMTALSSNKTINILSVLKKVKGDLDSAVINAAQNITDKIAYANNIDNAASIGTKADFDSETNLYTYHDGEGYNNNVKEQNHRGVIVLVTEGGKTTLVNGVAVTTNPTIHVKRMYISKDGLLCTKEFYDAEKAIGKSLLERLHDLDHLG